MKLLQCIFRGTTARLASATPGLPPGSRPCRSRQQSAEIEWRRGSPEGTGCCPRTVAPHPSLICTDGVAPRPVPPLRYLVLHVTSLRCPPRRRTMGVGKSHQLPEMRSNGRSRWRYLWLSRERRSGRRCFAAAAATLRQFAQALRQIDFQTVRPNRSRKPSIRGLRRLLASRPGFRARAPSGSFRLIVDDPRIGRTGGPFHTRDRDPFRL